MPEFQDQFLGSLFEYIKTGNSQIRHAAAECLARILQNQYSSGLRAELIASIKQELAESPSCAMRKTFLFFCKAAVGTFSKSFFKEHFVQSYISLSTDKVAAVRMEFANSLLFVKPWFEGDAALTNEMMSTLTKMHSDIDRDVVEAVETCDFKLLQIKKKTREQEKAAAAVDAQRVLIE
jgi:hypothetical protein